MKFQFRLSEQRDGDIIYWLNHTEDKSEAIRSAIRAAIEKEKLVSEMLEGMSRLGDPAKQQEMDEAVRKAKEEMARMNDPATQVQMAINDIKCEMTYADIKTLDDAKKQIGWMYPDGVIDQAWKEMFENE